MDTETVLDTDDTAVADAQQAKSGHGPEEENDLSTPDGGNSQQDISEGKNQDEDSPFPKKAQNLIARRDKQLAKARKEIAQMRAELTQFMQMQKSSAEAPKAPTEDQFDNFGDFLKAQTEFLANQKIAEALSKQSGQQPKLTHEQAQYVEWQDQRSAHIGNQAADMVQKVPELKELYEENADIIEAFPPQLEHMFLSLDNAPAAFYALAKEGKLESLLAMSPYMAAAEIRDAQSRGLQYIQQAQNKKTNAPRPMQPSKGSGGASKPLHQMSPDELVDVWLNS